MALNETSNIKKFGLPATLSSEAGQKLSLTSGGPVMRGAPTTEHIHISSFVTETGSLEFKHKVNKKYAKVVGATVSTKCVRVENKSVFTE